VIDAAAGRAEAIKSCRQAGAFIELAQANAPEPDVFRALDAAISSSRTAVDDHPHWVRLLSGLQDVRYALAHDDPDAAATGIGLVRVMCAEAGAALPGRQ
jgi:hypothetical protein